MSIAGVEGSHAVNSLEDPPAVAGPPLDARPVVPAALPGSVCEGAPALDDGEDEGSVDAGVVESDGEGELDREDAVSEAVGCPPEVEVDVKVDVDGREAEVLLACGSVVELDVPELD